MSAAASCASSRWRHKVAIASFASTSSSETTPKSDCRTAKRAYEQKVKVLQELTVSPEAIANNLQDLEDTNSDVVAEVRGLLSNYEATREHVREALANQREIPQIGIEHGPIINRPHGSQRRRKGGC